MRYPAVIVCALVLLAAIFLGLDKNPSNSAVHTLESGQAYEGFVMRLRAAIEENGLNIVEGACGKCAIKTIENIDENALIISVYRPDMMMKMLQSGAAAGAEPPLRFYVSKLEDGAARLTYHQPSKALAIYNAPALEPIGKELDGLFEKIVAAVR